VAGKRFLLVFCASVAAGVGVLALLLLILDPFDRGHGLFAKRGTLERGPRTANVSRGRDPAFNAAVFGNSHIQLLKPERLNAATGLSWVQLTVPATMPDEQVIVMHWFLHNHPGSSKALVIGTDHFWCNADPNLSSKHPFPRWLYSLEPVSYYSNLFRMQAVRLMPRKVSFLLGQTKARPTDGYWDYEAYRTRNEAQLLKEAEAARSAPLWNETGKYPWIERLARELAALDRRIAVILVAPPHFQPGMPPQGSAQAQAERACAAQLATVARNRPGTAFLDMRADRDAFSNPAHFWDTTHYSADVARAIETEIAKALRSIEASGK